MESTVDIIEIYRNRYILNSHNLGSALTSAQKCDGIALISIIGPQNSGKTFFFECLRNYLESDDKDKWPQNYNSTINVSKESTCNQHKKYPSIKLSSHPFILEDKIFDKIHKIAVFLMDSDMVFDHESEIESSRSIEDIMALCLPTSSTVIYNSKYNLQIKNLLKLQNSISRISSFENSMNILQKVLFLIREWNLEDPNYSLKFGSINGKRYLKKLIEKEKLSVNIEDITCYLMPTPGPNVNLETINLSHLLDQFKVDLKNLIPYKLLNIDEIKTKTKPIESTALPKYETPKQEKETVHNMNENNITEEKFEDKSEDFKTIAVENHSHFSSDSNTEYFFKSLDSIKYIDNDCDAKVIENGLVSRENSVLDKNLENNYITDYDNSISAADSCEESVNHNEDNDNIYSENEKEYDLCEDVNDANEPKDEQFITNVKSGNNSCSYIINVKNTDEIEEQKKSFSGTKILKNYLSLKEQSTQDYINSIIGEKAMTDSHVINMEKTDQNWANFTNQYLTGDKYFSAETYVHNFDDQNVGNNYSELNTKTSLIDESLVINETEEQLNDFVNVLLLKYNKRMESKLKDQNLYLEYGLSKVQKEIKYEIINEFEEYVKDMSSHNLVQKWKAKQNLRLIETMDISVDEYQEKLIYTKLQKENENISKNKRKNYTDLENTKEKTDIVQKIFTSDQFDEKNRELKNFAVKNHCCLENDLKKVENEKYKNEFLEEKKIGRGSFGVVYKIRKMSNDKTYAVKSIKIREKNLKYISREIEIISKLFNSNIVKYEDSWFEDSCEKSRKLYILMEYCESNLEKILKSMKVQFNEKLSCFNISSIGLYVRSELFFEIVQGLDYLHTRDPKIIHRDLNLRNILVKKSIDRNNIKISDFGLSVEHKKKSDRNLNSQSHSSDVGTPKFMAPEIATGTTYNEKSDIYSLGLVLRLMFEWSELEKKVPKSDKTIFQKVEMFFAKMEDLNEVKPDRRPTTEEILKKRRNISINYDDIMFDSEAIEIVNKLTSDDKTKWECDSKSDLISNIVSAKCKIEEQLRELVDGLISKYNNTMNCILKDVYFDFDSGLSKIHNEINSISNTFENYIKDVPSLNLKQKWKLKLNHSIEESLEEYQEKVKQKLIETRNEYQKVLKQMLKLYDIEMKDLIKAQLKTSLNNENLDHFHDRSKEKVERIFKEESVNFYKEDIHKEFLSKLNEKIIKSKNKYEIIFNHLNNFKTEVKEKLRKENYISENKINKIHANAKQRITNSMKKLEDKDLIEIAVVLFDKYLKFFKKCNEENDRQEQQIAKNAIDLALTLYNNCFEAKLKTGLFLQNEINDIHNKLFDYTLNALKKVCDFNEDQTYLIQRCEEDFRIKVVEGYEHIIANYQEMFDRTTNLLTKAKTDALKKYCAEMSSRLSAKTYFKNNEFNHIHHECSKIGFGTYDSLTEFVRKEFDSVTAKRIVLENHSDIRKNITTKMYHYKSLNDKNAPETSTIAVYFGHQYISAATYNKKLDVVIDENNRSLRPNSIAIIDGILYGSEAKDYYKKNFSRFPSFENFDIKQLIGRERKSVSIEELNTFPFEFLNDKLSVIINYEDFKCDLSIESLMALLVMNVKEDAEKQFSNIMSNIVITIPTNYNLVQKNAIRNVAKIAGFEDIHLITELSAAAVSYSNDISRKSYSNFRTVLFAIINGYECDVAICTITYNKIHFKAHYHQKLNLIQKESNYLIPKFLSPTNWIGNDHKNLTLKCLENLIEKILKTPLPFERRSYKRKDIDECVIAGDSQLISDVKDWMNSYFGSNILFNCDPIDTIINGSAIYSEMLSKKVPLIEVTEVTNFPIHTILRRNQCHDKTEKVFDQNIILPHVKCHNFNCPKKNDLPLKILVIQDKMIVMSHLIETIPTLYSHRSQWSYFDSKFTVNNFGDITLESFVANYNCNKRQILDSIVIENGLSERNIEEEQQKINLLLKKIEEKKKLSNQESLVEQSKVELINYCMEEKKKFENNSELRSLIKRQILKEIDETLNYLKTKVLNLKDVKTKKQKLDNALEILLN